MTRSYRADVASERTHMWLLSCAVYSVAGQAMQTKDSATGKLRGYCVMQKSANVSAIFFRFKSTSVIASFKSMFENMKARLARNGSGNGHLFSCEGQSCTISSSEGIQASAF